MNEEEIKKRFEKIEKRLDILESRGEVIKEIPLNALFEEQDGKIIVTRIVGESPKEKTKNIVLLSLLGYKQKLNELEVLSSKLKESVATHTVPLENFATWIKELIPQSIIRKGKVGSKKMTYRLTTFGEAKAKNLLKEILEDETDR